MTTPQVIMVILLTLRFVGPIARAFGAEFPHRKESPPWAQVFGASVVVGTYAGVMAWGGFW